MTNYKLNCFVGKPINFEEYEIYPPTIKQLIEVPDNTIYTYLLTIDQVEIDKIFTENGQKKITEVEYIPTPFEYLLGIAYNDEKSWSLVIKSFQFYTRKIPVMNFEKKEIILIDSKFLDSSIEELEEAVKEHFIINADNFLDFQNVIRASMDNDKVLEDRNLDPRVRGIKAKGRYREQVKNRQKKGIELVDIISSICCMGIGLNPLNIGELTYACTMELLKRYQAKEQYGIDLNLMTVPFADTKSIKPKYWIANLMNN